MATIEDSGFGVNSIKVKDESIRTVDTTTVLNLLPSLHPVFASDGLDNKIREMNSMGQVESEYGDDFTDSDTYGQQNIQVENVVNAGGTAWTCRLLPNDATRAHLIFKVGVKQVDDIPLWKRDIYGEFILDEDGNKVPVTYTEVGTVPGDGGAAGVEGVGTERQVTVSGYKLKLFVESAPEAVVKKHKYTASLARAVGNITTDPTTNYKIFPLFFMSYYANGRCGENYGLRIINDFKRDSRVNDGRRYELFLGKKTSRGFEPLSIGNDIGFSFNPRAKVNPNASALEGLNTVYKNYDGSVAKQIQIEVYTHNYDKLEAYLEELLSQDIFVDGELSDDQKEALIVPKNAKEFDFINGYDREGLAYDNVVVDNVRPYKYDDQGEIVKDAADMPVYDDAWVSSVDISVPKYMMGGYDGKEFEEPVSDEQLEATKENLLIQFFKGMIDTPTITNVLKCDAGIIYDANYSMAVKKSIMRLLNERRDISVIFDCGFAESLEEAVAIAKDIRGWVPDPMDGGENYAICPHSGVTVGRAVDVRVTGTYEMSYGITRLYRTDPFAVYAGKPKDRGCVRKTVFDWVIEETIPKGTQRKLAKQNKLYWATDLGKAVTDYAIGNITGRNIYFYSNASLYGEDISKLAEFRNGLLCNDIRRMAKLILVKYTFDSDGAESAMDNAKEEMYTVFKSRYPANVIITFNIMQTPRDKLINEATAKIAVIFPDIFEQWNVEISAGRAE